MLDYCVGLGSADSIGMSDGLAPVTSEGLATGLEGAGSVGRVAGSVGTCVAAGVQAAIVAAAMAMVTRSFLIICDLSWDPAPAPGYGAPADGATGAGPPYGRWEIG